jgi:hypothetical protein
VPSILPHLTRLSKKILVNGPTRGIGGISSVVCGALRPPIDLDVQTAGRDNDRASSAFRSLKLSPWPPVFQPVRKIVVNNDQSVPLHWHPAKCADTYGTSRRLAVHDDEAQAFRTEHPGTVSNHGTCHSCDPRSGTTRGPIPSPRGRVRFRRLFLLPCRRSDARGGSGRRPGYPVLCGCRIRSSGPTFRFPSNCSFLDACPARAARPKPSPDVLGGLCWTCLNSDSIPPQPAIS